MEPLTMEVVAQYISVGGSVVDQLGKEGTPLNLPKKYIANCELFNEKQIPKKKRYNEIKQLVKELISVYGEPNTWEQPMDIGLGSLKESRTAKSYFRVIYWPFGQKMRKHIGLKPTDFHITVGFHPKDIHSYKGPASLEGLIKRKNTISPKKLPMLANIANEYTHDIEFLQHLLRLCKLNDMEMLADSWRHHVKEADKRFTSVKKRRRKSGQTDTKNE
ncbi:unnamed protein product [Cunninghamella blakesleeana]